MRFLVSGAAGFLGFYIAERLAQDPANRVIIVDNFSRGVADEAYEALSAAANVTRFDLDLNDPAAVAILPRDVDVVFHMAALNGTQNFYERPFEVLRSCTLPTIFLVEHFGNGASKPRFVYAGTSEAYAATVTQFGWSVPTAEDVPLCIDDPFNPRWSYGASKLHGEIAVINGCRHFGMPFTIVRFHNAYGPRMGDKHVIPDFLERAGNGEYSLYGGKDTRSFLYAADAAEATIELAFSDKADGEVFHVGGQREISMIELAQIMMDQMGVTGELQVHSAPTGSVPRRCPDVRKAEAVIGKFERTSLEEGLQRTIASYLPAFAS